MSGNSGFTIGSKRPRSSGTRLSWLNAELSTLKALLAELRLTVADTRKTKAEPVDLPNPLSRRELN